MLLLRHGQRGREVCVGTSGATPPSRSKVTSLMSGELEIRVEQQRSAVADEVSALTAVVRPILEGTLYAVNKEVIAEAGGHDGITLGMLARVYRPGDGDCGLCFEWAVHDAMNRHDPLVEERIADALARFCKVPGQMPASILFGGEKSGAVRLIDTARERLTDDSRILVGSVGQPPKLKPRLRLLAYALRSEAVRAYLPYSISGLWKADLFLGHTDSDRWVGTTVKINPSQVEPAKGLRLAIVPVRQGKTDKISVDHAKNLVICPLPHDGAFMEIFYQGWGIVQQFIRADARCPKEVALPRPPERQVARYLEDRRGFPVVDVLDALIPLSQPELLETLTHKASTLVSPEKPSRVEAMIAPRAKTIR